MSLSEYRKRIKQQKGSLPPRGASSNSSKSHRTPSPSVGRDSCVQPRLAPLPMFNAFRSPDLRAADLGNGELVSVPFCVCFKVIVNIVHVKNKRRCLYFI